MATERTAVLCIPAVAAASVWNGFPEFQGDKWQKDAAFLLQIGSRKDLASRPPATQSPASRIEWFQPLA
jgi:hypothetical protein